MNSRNFGGLTTPWKELRGEGRRGKANSKIAMEVTGKVVIPSRIWTLGRRNAELSGEHALFAGPKTHLGEVS